MDKDSRQTDRYCQKRLVVVFLYSKNNKSVHCFKQLISRDFFEFKKEEWKLWQILSMEHLELEPNYSGLSFISESKTIQVHAVFLKHDLFFVPENYHW